MGTWIVKVTRNKETHPDPKTHHSKKKINFLKEIINNIKSKRQLLKKVENTHTCLGTKWKQKLSKKIQSLEIQQKRKSWSLHNEITEGRN